MPTRVLQHGFAPTTENHGLEPGRWTDLPIHAQFLIDLEFLMRYTSPLSGASCIYCQSPPYLKEIAGHFPWVHFYAYNHKEDPHAVGEEYDPYSPSIAPITVQVLGNMTIAEYEFTNSIARRLGENSGFTTRVMIGHCLGSTRQLSLHALLRPCYSLLDVEGLIPPDYPEGEIVLPMFIDNNKIFTSLVVAQQARCREYNQALFQNEIGENQCARLVWGVGEGYSCMSYTAGFFQGFVRITQSYDEASKNVIAAEYARYTHRHHKCPEDILRMALLSTVDLLQVQG